LTKIEIFKAGRHTAMGGETIAFSAADLDAAAKAYDPTLHEAPLCIGHPEHDAPAYGWVGKLSFADGALEAEPHQVDPQFAEIVKAGRYKKISASFYLPDSPSNPKPGVYYLRHVGFLGAMPPSVKGLKQVQFAGNADEIVVFGDLAPSAPLLRRLHSFISKKFGAAEADRVIPAADLDGIEPAPLREDSMDFAEQQRQLDAQRRELDARQKELDDRDKKIKTTELSFAEQADARRREANGAFLEILEREGRVLPAHRPLLLAFLERLEGGATVTIEFGEGEKARKTDLALPDAFREFLKRLPPQVSFAEVARPEVERAPAATRPFVTPPGFKVDAGELDLRDRALAYAEKHKVDFVEAVRILESTAA
jgi:hypothetical protein